MTLCTSPGKFLQRKNLCTTISFSTKTFQRSSIFLKGLLYDSPPRSFLADDLHVDEILTQNLFSSVVTYLLLADIPSFRCCHSR